MRMFALLVLGMWLGAMLFFAIGVAPHLFNVLEPVDGGRVLAGQVAGHSLRTLHTLGLVCGLVFLAASGIANKQVAMRQHFLMLVMLAVTLLSQFGVAPSIESLRSDLGKVSVSELPPSDERRVTFERLHRTATLLEAFTFVLGLVVFSAAARRRD